MTGSWSTGRLGGELTEGSGGEEQGRRWKEEDGGRVTDKKIHSKGASVPSAPLVTRHVNKLLLCSKTSVL